MDLTNKMIKQAVANLADFVPMVKSASVKTALTPAVGGQIPPPAGGPPGGPMDPSMGGAPPMDPSMGGAPPMDPSMGGMPPGGPPGAGGPPMDPSMGPPPMDPSMMGPPPEADPLKKEETEASEANLAQGQAQGDVMVPLRAVTDHTVKVIEATKGKRTADAAPPGAKAPAAPGGPAANLGGAPGAVPMSLPGLGGKAAGARIEALIKFARSGGKTAGVPPAPVAPTNTNSLANWHKNPAGGKFYSTQADANAGTNPLPPSPAPVAPPATVAPPAPAAPANTNSLVNWHKNPAGGFYANQADANAGTNRLAP